MLQASNINRVLGSFVPTEMSFTFASENREVADLPKGPLHQTSPYVIQPGNSNEDELDLVADVPEWLLAHELTHLLQTCCTSSGLRAFLEANRNFLVGAQFLDKAAEVTPGIMKVSLMDAYAYDGPDDMQWFLRQVFHYFFNQLKTAGGLLYPSAHARQFAGGDARDGDLFRCDGLFPDSSVWCLDLTKFGGPTDVVVTLGNMHLYEAYAHTVEYFRCLQPAYPEELAVKYFSENAPPFHPYLIARTIYDTLVEPHPKTALDHAEFMAVLDTALMCDSWLTIPPENIEATLLQDGCAIEIFLAMCQAMNTNRSELTLRDVGPKYVASPEYVASFQNSLLQAISAPVTDVEELTRAAKDRWPAVFSEIRRISPFGGFLDQWSATFEEQLRYRAELGGACPGLRLVYADAEDLRHLTVASSPIIERQYLTLTDDGSAGELLQAQAARHLNGLQNEIIFFGREPCPVRDRCILTTRSACHGITDQFEPVGQRCSREYAIGDIMSKFGISTFQFDQS